MDALTMLISQITNCGHPERVDGRVSVCESLISMLRICFGGLALLSWDTHKRDAVIRTRWHLLLGLQQCIKSVGSEKACCEGIKKPPQI
ncbi:hypothetical protein CEXT_497071 [Caerostris extrusa]|uniref:Uncharacterized protein n=1 Tax=Caerostris extrusa TaxID=172846 RepID=A0AAV4V2U1_CAEEX|nr:hypothetical protein CEXT_497071 [Caerostris extrusa]